MYSFYFLLILFLFLFFLFKTIYSKGPNTQINTLTFQPEWRNILRKYVVFYRTLNEQEKIEFENRVLKFLNKVKVTGIKTTVEETDLLLVASSAVIPVFAFPNFEYTTIKEVLLYPDFFNESFEITGADRRIGGMVGTGSMEGLMILSKPLLRKGFSNARDKKNVGIHEFLHLLDKEDGKIDGIPDIFLENAPSLPWMQLSKKKIDQILKNKSDINPYGATNAEEFFAVAGEYYFERPGMLRQKHPELYHFLAKVFKQNLFQKFNDNLFVRKKIRRNDPCICGSGKKFKNCCGQPSGAGFHQIS